MAPRFGKNGAQIFKFNNESVIAKPRLFLGNNHVVVFQQVFRGGYKFIVLVFDAPHQGRTA